MKTPTDKQRLNFLQSLLQDDEVVMLATGGSVVKFTGEGPTVRRCIDVALKASKLTPRKK